MDALHPAGDDFNAAEHRIACSDESHKLLVKHDDILVFNLLSKNLSGNREFLPVSFDRQDAETPLLEMLSAFIPGRGKIGFAEYLSIFTGQATKIIRHLFKSMICQ
jgi:hypothetical protein